jgi:hypothetical protein
MADEYGCDAIGIQYQQGLRDMTPASDLVEGLLKTWSALPSSIRMEANYLQAKRRRISMK